MATVCPSMPSGSYLVLCDLRVPKRKPRKASVLKGGRRSGGFVAFWRGRNSRVPVYIGSPQVVMFVPTNGSHLGCLFRSRVCALVLILFVFCPSTLSLFGHLAGCPGRSVESAGCWNRVEFECALVSLVGQ